MPITNFGLNTDKGVLVFLMAVVCAGSMIVEKENIKPMNSLFM